jgi:hypothetical protein
VKTLKITKADLTERNEYFRTKKMIGLSGVKPKINNAD